MTTNTNATLADIPAAGAKALADYLKDCDAHEIQPDVGGAFAYAFRAGAALTTAAAVPPEGWVMVPVEPTKEMIEHAHHACDGTYAGDVYRAMVSAAPKAEPVQAGEYPPLPTRRRAFLCTKCGGRECEPGTLNETHPTCKCGYLGFAEDLDFTADEMRAYVDADRAMRAQAAPAQPGAAYAKLPTPHGKNVGEPCHYTADQMLDFADRTHALRASRGQAPAPAAVAHIQQPFTIAEIKAKIASNDYSAELLLQHAMLLLDKPAAVAGPSRDLHPEKCPITGRPFFMVLDHPELGPVPTYGGPFDSYTIPAPEGEPTDPWHERELRCERFDHDAGYWVEGGEPIPLRIVHDDVLDQLQSDAATPTTQAAPGTGPNETIQAAVDALIRAAWSWGEGCGVDSVPWGAEGDSHNEMQRGEVDAAKRHLLSVLATQAAPQPAQAWPIAPDVAADLERSDWTPEEALRWYAAGKHYDTVPNGDGTSSARILDTGEVASNALRAYEQPPSTGVEPGRLLAEHVLGMDFVTDRGLRARELARKVLAQHCTAAPQPAVQQGAATIDAGDAVFAFASMLTTLPHIVPFGSAAWATPGAELASAFNAANGLSVSLDFPSGLSFPEIKGELLACVERAAKSAAPAAQGDAEDAARYRWLRCSSQGRQRAVFLDSETVDELDAAIDAARSKQQGDKPT